MARGQIWQNFPKLLRFMALFPSLKSTKTSYPRLALEVPDVPSEIETYSAALPDPHPPLEKKEDRILRGCKP